ncbi:MAG: hypothetical protein ACRCTA_06310, partial [Bacilli bacterium]
VTKSITRIVEVQAVILTPNSPTNNKPTTNQPTTNATIAKTGLNATSLVIGLILGSFALTTSIIYKKQK